MYLLDWVPIRIPRFFFCLRDKAHEMSQKSPTWDLFVESKVTHNASPQFFCVFVLPFLLRWWGLKKNRHCLGGGNSNMFCSPRTWTLGKWSYLTSIFVQMGWFNRQVAMITLEKTWFVLVLRGEGSWNLGDFFFVFLVLKAWFCSKKAET